MPPSSARGSRSNQLAPLQPLEADGMESTTLLSTPMATPLSAVLLAAGRAGEKLILPALSTPAGTVMTAKSAL